MENLITNLQKYKKHFREKGIKHLYLVGSFSRGEQNENSDIDLLFSLSEKHNLGIFEFIKLKIFLEKEMGKNIDLVEETSVNKHLKKFLEDDKIFIF